MRIIDAWMQHPTPGFLGDPMFASLRRWMGIGDTIPAVPLAATVGALDAAGVEIGLLSAWWGPRGPMITNEEVAGWVKQHPDRFRGVCAVDLRDPMGAVRKIQRCVAQGFVGVRMLPWLWEAPANHRRFYPIYAECVAQGVPFCLQVGHTGPLRGSEFGRPVPYLDDVALDFPELVIVGGHIGYPWTREMIALATKFPNVYIDTSAYKPSRYPKELVSFMGGHGRRKVLFGSNYPMIQPAACLAQVDALGLDDEAKALFLGENTARVFGI